MDPYKRLGVSIMANEIEINSAYRRLSIKIHPDKNQHPEAKEQFIQLTEAKELLLNKQKKLQYDMDHGIEWQRMEYFYDRGQFLSVHQRNSYQQFYFEYRQFQNFFMGHQQNLYWTQDSPVKRDLEVTREELTNGCVKTLTIPRFVLTQNGTRVEERTECNITIVSGSREGSTITLTKAGNQKYGSIPANYIFVLRVLDEPSPTPHKKETSSPKSKKSSTQVTRKRKTPEKYQFQIGDKVFAMSKGYLYHWPAMIRVQCPCDSDSYFEYYEVQYYGTYTLEKIPDYNIVKYDEMSKKKYESPDPLYPGQGLFKTALGEVERGQDPEPPERRRTDTKRQRTG